MLLTFSSAARDYSHHANEISKQWTVTLTLPLLGPVAEFIKGFALMVTSLQLLHRLSLARTGLKSLSTHKQDQMPDPKRVCDLKSPSN